MKVKNCNTTPRPLKSWILHCHSHWEIMLITSGKITMTVDGTPHILDTGDIIVLPPESYHEEVAETLYTNLYIQAEDLDFDGLFTVSDMDGHIKTLMLMMRKIMLEKEQDYREISDSILSTVCRMIKKHIGHEYKYKFVHEMKNLLYENISNSDFLLSDITLSFNYNLDYIRRCFIKETGKTPHEYLTDLRLNQAKALILQENFISVSDVAEKCGFKDNFYFSTAFKKRYGKAPLAYRKDKIT